MWSATGVATGAAATAAELEGWRSQAASAAARASRHRVWGSGRIGNPASEEATAGLKVGRIQAVSKCRLGMNSEAIVMNRVRPPLHRREGMREETPGSFTEPQTVF